MVEQAQLTTESAAILDQPDLRSGIIINSYVADQRVVGLAQPSTWDAEGLRTAAAAMAACISSLQSSRYMVDMSDVSRLTRAFGEANDAVRNRNRMRNGHEHSGAIGVGLVLALRGERDATIGLVPPAAVAIFQRGQVRWVPDLDSWQSRATGLPGAPLGWTGVPRPTYVKSHIEPGDEIAIVSQPVAEGLISLHLNPGKSSELCTAICDLGERSATGCDDLVAVVTQIDPASMSRSVRVATGNLIGGTENRAKAVWAALRSGASPLAD